MNAAKQTLVSLRPRVFAQKLSTGCRGPGNKMYMGTAAISDGDYIHHAINHSDLIILVGHDVRPCI